MNIGEQIKSRRIELNMTQSELADRLSVTRAAVSNWETEKNYPDLQVIVDISEELGISLDTLLKGDTNVVEKIAKDTKDSNLLRRKSKVFATIIVALVVALGGVCAFYFAVWHPTYMSYEDSGLYVKENKLVTNGNYYSFQSFDASDNKTAFIYMTTTYYEKHRKVNANEESKELMDLNEYARSIVHDDKGNVSVSDTITEVYYVPESEVGKLNQKGGYWGDTEEENKEKVDHLKSVSHLVWKAE
ncbi:MAG: helix-turn-helix domain-containing protein [Oribacterium sp.]|nr:helix-turn-helix domain-containing protein [Oribacterium sp.]